MNQRVGPEFLAQRAPIDAQDAGSLALIAVRIVEHGLEQRPLDFTDDEVVQIPRPVAVQVFEIFIERVFGVLVQWLAAIGGLEC